MKNILVTGATGFIGTFLCQRLIRDGWTTRGTLLASEDSSALIAGTEPTVIDSLGPDTLWTKALSGIDTVIHLAARVHIMNDIATEPLSEFRKVNVLGTECIALQAAKSGVKRLVFVSTIKVNGEESPFPYSSESPTKPTDPYGISKCEAEIVLRRVEAETGLEVIIIRPTLVYGPGVKSNFLRMMKVVERGIPLPLSSVHNRRSLIYVGNLVDALVTCAVYPDAAGKTYLISDGDDVSTPELIRRVAHALNKPARLFPVHEAIIRLFGKLSGKNAAVNRLLGSLTVDSSQIRRELGWLPPFTMEEGLRFTTEWYKNNVQGSRSKDPDR